MGFTKLFFDDNLTVSNLLQVVSMLTELLQESLHPIDVASNGASFHGTQDRVVLVCSEYRRHLVQCHHLELISQVFQALVESLHTHLNVFCPQLFAKLLLRLDETAQFESALLQEV